MRTHTYRPTSLHTHTPPTQVYIGSTPPPRNAGAGAHRHLCACPWTRTYHGTLLSSFPSPPGHDDPCLSGLGAAHSGLRDQEYLSHTGPPYLHHNGHPGDSLPEEDAEDAM